MRGLSIQIPPSPKPAVVCMVLVAIVIMSFGVGQVARRQHVIRLGYELTEAIADLQALREENRRLRLEKSVLTNPERIEKLARAVGMRQPKTGQIRQVRFSPHLAATDCCSSPALLELAASSAASPSAPSQAKRAKR